MVRVNVSSNYQFYLLTLLIVRFENVVFHQENIAFYHFAHILAVIVQSPSL